MLICIKIILKSVPDLCRDLFFGEFVKKITGNDAEICDFLCILYINKSMQTDMM